MKVADSKAVWVVVLTWNGKSDTIDCISSLIHQDYPTLHILVVDNCSTDRTVEELQSRFGSHIKLLVNRENLGFCVGNNVGINYALERGAEYIVLLNNDTIAHDTALVTKLVAAMESDHRIGLACPTIYYAKDPQRPWYAGASYSLWWGGGHHIQVLPKSLEIADTGYATGCCLIIGRQTIDRVGLLDEDYYLYEEDVDWSLRVKRAGLRVIYVPRAGVLHRVSRSARDASGKGAYSPEVVRYKFRNRILLIRKHGNVAQRFVLWPTLICAQVAYHFCGYLLFRRWEKIAAMSCGIASGLTFRLGRRSTR